MQILCLCLKESLTTNCQVEYAREIRARGIDLICVEVGTHFDASVPELLKLCTEEPLAIFYPDSDFPLLPKGLTDAQIPTICFQVDTYAFTDHRYKWSCLFDNVAVFHPNYLKRFNEWGHAGTFLLPHAVRSNLYKKALEERVFDIGWVGQIQGPIYRRRENLLPQLAKSFKMNQWRRRYNSEELADTYLRSRIVVNIGRDDYQQDANMRTFEAMAGGALLITALPSELTDLGFVEGQDFVGYRQEAEVLGICKHYLNDEYTRSKISQAGRDKVLKHHTYQQRVDYFLEQLRSAKGRFSAPARSWPKTKVQMAYLDYYAANNALRQAVKLLPKLMLHNPKCGAEGSTQILRAFGRKAVGMLRK
jgi:Glycosyl transferases group 1